MLHVLLMRFNSMKVRLKRNGNFDFEVREQFQFHEGPIKTRIIIAKWPLRLYVSIP